MTATRVPHKLIALVLLVACLVVAIDTYRVARDYWRASAEPILAMGRR